MKQTKFGLADATTLQADHARTSLCADRLRVLFNHHLLNLLVVPVSRLARFSKDLLSGPFGPSKGRPLNHDVGHVSDAAQIDWGDSATAASAAAIAALIAAPVASHDGAAFGA